MPEPMSDAVFTTFVQICCAFAQGAGHLQIEPEAILEARADYTPQIERGLERWERDRPQTLAAARAMGALAAATALREGVATISRSHYQTARTTLHVHIFCPFHHKY